MNVRIPAVEKKAVQMRESELMNKRILPVNRKF
jgi:hypothetical protein